MTHGFWKAGHPPTLFAAFLYFDIAFMVWVMLGPLGVQIAKTLALTAAQKGLMVATPVLAGALLRIVMGILVDHLKPKMAGTIGQVIVIAGLAWAWLAGIHSYREILILGVMLGFAGAAFAVALPLASRWYWPWFRLFTSSIPTRSMERGGPRGIDWCDPGWRPTRSTPATNGWDIKRLRRVIPPSAHPGIRSIGAGGRCSPSAAWSAQSP